MQSYKIKLFKILIISTTNHTKLKHKKKISNPHNNVHNKKKIHKTLIKFLT